jgi:hypothetical protein
MVQTLAQHEKASSTAGVRPLLENDVPRVADLIWQVLHERQGTAPAALRAYVDELFLGNPWVQEDIPSLVYQDSEAKIVGFFGIVPRPMSIQGKTLRFAFGSNFVVEPGSRASLAAMQLVNAYIKGPQDVSITDSATDAVRQLFTALGFNVLRLYSLVWARPLRPSTYAVHGASRLKKSKTIANLGTMVSPICRVADYLATTAKFSPFRQVSSPLTSEEMDTETLRQCIARIPSKHCLVPQYTPESLAWVLNFVERRNAYGSLRKLLLRDHKGKIVGWYVYGLQPGRVGEVLQIGVDNIPAGKVLDHLFYDAWRSKLIGLHGRMEPQFMEELTRESSFFLRTGSWALAHSRSPELLAPIFSGNAFFSRLDGEGCLRFGASQV